MSHAKKEALNLIESVHNALVEPSGNDRVLALKLGEAYALIRQLSAHTDSEFDRLRQRVTRLRRAAREANRKILNQHLYAEARMRWLIEGENPATQMARFHHVQELQRKLRDAEARIAELEGKKSEAAE